MKQKHSLLALFIIFWFSSCECGSGTALITFINNSHFDVSDAGISSRGDEGYIALLRSKETVTLIKEWPGTSSTLDIHFIMDGLEYGTRMKEECDGIRYKPYKPVYDGDHFTVTIYDNYWTYVLE